MSVCTCVLFYATARIPLHTSAYLCIPLCTSAHTSVYLCVPLPRAEVYRFRGKQRGKQRYTPLYTSVYLCPYLCIPLYTSALGRGTQRYTEVCASAYLCLPLCTSVSSAFYHVSKSRFPGIIQKHGIKKQTKVSCQPGSLPTTAMPGF